MHTMHPFMAAELPSFDLATALRQGLVPLVTMTADPADTVAAYAGLYLEQEVKAEGLTRNVSDEDLLLAWQLPVFTHRAGRATVSHAKFYLFDAGVFRSRRPRGPLDRPEEIDGAALV